MRSSHKKEKKGTTSVKDGRRVVALSVAVAGLTEERDNKILEVGVQCGRTFKPALCGV